MFFLNIFFLISNSFAKENFILNWDKLIPLNAYDFVPETGITFEMWDDKNFVKKLNEAGLKFNKKIIGKSIKLYGFMVPLEMDYHEDLIVNEFILVPSAGMCIHVPPPPPNQMVLIKLDKPQKARYMYQPISVEGILKILLLLKIHLIVFMKLILTISLILIMMNSLSTLKKVKNDFIFNILICIICSANNLV